MAFPAGRTTALRRVDLRTRIAMSHRDDFPALLATRYPVVCLVRIATQ